MNEWWAGPDPIYQEEEWVLDVLEKTDRSRLRKIEKAGLSEYHKGRSLERAFLGRVKRGKALPNDHHS